MASSDPMAPACPKCAASGDRLRFVGREQPGGYLSSVTVVEGYQCQTCGMGFTFGRPVPSAARARDGCAT